MKTETHRKLFLNSRLLAPFGVFLAAVLFMTCGPKDAKSPKQRGQKEKVKDKGLKLTDSRIREWVETELHFDQALDTSRVMVTVDQGIVKLTGNVKSISEKKRAQRVAQTVRGVRAVVNDILVDPLKGLTDTSIQEMVSQALLEDPATRRFQIDIDVKDHTVSLTGTVGSWQQSLLAEKVAGSVKGVKSVTNALVVSHDTERSDEQIQAEVKKALRWNALVGHELIEVEVDGAKVVLTGKVGSAAERARAISIARVRGVRKVDANGLKVAVWARNRRRRVRRHVIKSDDAIRDAVNDALVYEPRVFSFSITPEVRAGVVTLRGKVDNLNAMRAAAQVARNTVGVLAVRNRIKLKTEPRGDEEIESAILASFSREPYLQDEDLRVEVQNGVVELHGAVDTFFEKGRAQDVATRVSGVLVIENKLDVEKRDEPLTYDPYVDEYPVYETDWYDYEPLHTFKSDRRIKEKIRQGLWWSPFVDSDQIIVQIDDGEVTLKGEVDSIKEWRAATQEAYEGGATWVKNKIRIQNE